MENITAFIDESGTIAKGIVENQDYFVIAIIFTNNTQKMNKVFKKARMKIIKKSELLIESLKLNKEIKGSEISEKQKESIYSDVTRKCKEDFEIGIIILDNMKSAVKLRTVSARTFNYLIVVYLDNFFRKFSRYKDITYDMSFIIDERNVATNAKYQLTEYLNTQLNTQYPICEGEIMTVYKDSKNHMMIQFADFIANTVYRQVQKHSPESIDNIRTLENNICCKKYFKFPMGI